ncbi:MAG: hypothetical protein MR739_02460 [Spirochaetia bacterium]|nr:hypothetical protein [Spirochaetia bacterium]
MLRQKKREMHSIFSSRVCIANSRFSGFRRQSASIPSLRFGTGFASPYNPCHGLKLQNLLPAKKIHYLTVLSASAGLNEAAFFELP